MSIVVKMIIILLVDNKTTLLRLLLLFLSLSYSQQLQPYCEFCYDDVVMMIPLVVVTLLSSWPLLDKSDLIRNLQTSSTVRYRNSARLFRPNSICRLVHKLNYAKKQRNNLMLQKETHYYRFTFDDVKVVG